MLSETEDIFSTNIIMKMNQEFKESEKCADFSFNFEQLEMIGSGAFGKVYRVQSKTTQQEYALKMMLKSQISELKLWTQLKNEIRILGICNHPNIIKIYAVFEETNHFCILMEYFNGKTLFQHLQKKQRLSEDETCIIMRKVVSTLCYLHSMSPKILHRDLKPENILIKNKQIKIIDFGWSNQNDDFRNTYCGTPDYLSPEMIMGTGHNEKLDIWTLGILMYELLSGTPPFSPKVRINDKRIQQRQIEENILKGNLNFNFEISQDAKYTIKILLSPNPENRPTSNSVLDLPFFQKMEQYQDISKRLEQDNIKNLINQNDYLKKRLKQTELQLDLEKKDKEKIILQFNEQTQRESKLIQIVERLEDEVSYLKTKLKNKDKVQKNEKITQRKTKGKRNDEIVNKNLEEKEKTL